MMLQLLLIDRVKEFKLQKCLLMVISDRGSNEKELQKLLFESFLLNQIITNSNSVYIILDKPLNPSTSRYNNNAHYFVNAVTNEWSEMKRKTLFRNIFLKKF